MKYKRKPPGAHARRAVRQNSSAGIRDFNAEEWSTANPYSPVTASHSRIWEVPAKPLLEESFDPLKLRLTTVTVTH